jgi:hypothetical protein
VSASPSAGTGATTEPRRWPRWLRRDRMEAAASIVIAAGLAMMMQSIELVLYTWSFAVTLFGTAMFLVVSKFPP